MYEKLYGFPKLGQNGRRLLRQDMIDSRLLAMTNIGVSIGMNNPGGSLYGFPFPNEYRCTMDLRRILKTTERYVALLNVNGIFTVKDFLNYFPRTHEDRQTISSSFITKENDNPLSGLGNEKQRVRVLVTEKKITVLRNKKKIYQVLFEDEDGVKGSAGFRGTGYQLQNIEKNQRYVIVGKPKLLKGKVSFSNPEFIPSSAPLISSRISEDEEKISEDFVVGNKEIDKKTEKIIGILYKLHNALGPSQTEKLYHDGLFKLLQKEFSKVEYEKKITYSVDGTEIGLGKMDLVVDGVIALELKSRQEIIGDNYKQLRTYIDQSDGIQCGLLVNFFHKSVEIKRLNRNFGKNQINTSDFQENTSSEIFLKSSDILPKSNIDTLAITDDTYNIGRPYPIYPELQGIKPGRFAKKMREVLHHIESEYIEYLPDDFRNEFGLIDIVTMVKGLHYPKDFDELSAAKHRLYFDKLLKVQLQSLIARDEYKKSMIGSDQKSVHHTDEIDRSVIKEMMDGLPFSLTDAQKKVIKQTIEDVHKSDPMLRLVQGDVGSGKTIVSAICAYYIIRKMRGQVALLVPIEVLAIQHFANFVKLFHPLGIQVRLLTGSVTASQKLKIKQEMKSGLIDIVIGTHAIIQDDVEFRNLKFVVIDEQHKFGVKQRSFFKKFGSPHILQMTATPIPRTLALAYFAEFDVSIIDQMPAGRKPIITKVVTKKERTKLKYRIIDRMKLGQSVFVVVPLVYENEQMEGVHSAEMVYDEMKAEFSDYLLSSEIGLMHGKLSSKEKDDVMQKFKNNTSKILVSTTVIEVGVDVPQATIMIIKNSERFGLSQLHQLRGRVGRSDIQSYCFLETKNIHGNERLKAMEDHTDGFKLAEIDMKLRGTGEVMGYRQSGESDIPTEILMDITFIEKVQQAAFWLFEHYPGLKGLKILESEMDYVDGEIMV